MASCPFYAKRCSFLAPCCGEEICCFRCHDQVADHILPRQLLQHVVCHTCQHSQPLAKGDTCLTCGNHFADYFCTYCGTANDDVPAAGYFHCDSCGICRVGTRQEFFHCNGCGCCLRRALQGNHICHDRVLEAPCPICLDRRPLFSSQHWQAPDMLPCGHFAHKSCIDSTSTPLHAVCRACTGASSSRSYRSPRPAAAAPTGAAGANSSAGSSSSSSQYRASNHASSGAAGTHAGSPSGRIGYVQDLMGLLEGSFQPREAAEVESMLRELYEVDGLLPQREVKFSREAAPNLQACLHSHPKQFRQCLEAAIVDSVLWTQAEVAAKGRAIDAVVQLLQRTSSNGALRIAGQLVTIDRFAVAGSVGKGVSVQDDFDIDLVAFVNIPTAGMSDPPFSINLADPDVTHNSVWMRQLQQQVLACLRQPGGLSAGAEITGGVRQGRTAITFVLSVLVPESGDEVELEVDVLLAPNLAAGAGAVAAAKLGVRGGEPADIQRRAVLAPVLALANKAISTRRRGLYTHERNMFEVVGPSYARNIWLTEAATEFVQQAAVAAADSGHLSGRVVSSTIRLVKAWVRRGLQPQGPGFKKLKSFMIELIVLHAAQTFGSRQRAAAVSSYGGFGGRYVLDLLLESLGVMVEWANAADPAAAAGPFAAPEQPILFTELVGGKYYSSEQAKALMTLPLPGATSCYGPGQAEIRKQFSVMPVVVHPVDPASNVFAQEEGRRFVLWGVLRREALLLLQQLKQYSWEEIMQES